MITPVTADGPIPLFELWEWAAEGWKNAPAGPKTDEDRADDPAPVLASLAMASSASFWDSRLVPRLILLSRPRSRMPWMMRPVLTRMTADSPWPSKTVVSGLAKTLAQCLSCASLVSRPSSPSW